MLHRAGVPLAPLTTLRLGGPASTLVTALTEDDIVSAVREADRRQEPLLILGGGSNVVLPDSGFAGTVVHIVSRGVSASAEGGVVLTAAAGEPWEPLVDFTVAERLSGLEFLSGIPGSAGGTPVQNVGAYGSEISHVVESVRVLDRVDETVQEVPAARCRFGYRNSLFKHTDRYVVLSVTLRLGREPLSEPVRYPELAGVLDIGIGDRAPIAEVRSAVLALRRGKGMVTDPADPDTCSVGSFFVNPVVDGEAAAAVAARAGTASIPSWPEPDGGTKLSAAWLIEQAGFARGYGDGAVGISGKHTLALVHRGGGTSAELLALARTIRDRVRDRFGVELRPEPRLVGTSL